MPKPRAVSSPCPPARLSRRGVLFGALALGGCQAVPFETEPEPAGPPAYVMRRYGEIIDGGFRIAPVPPRYLTERTYRVTVAYTGPEPAGTIVVDPYARVLYYVLGPSRAYRYGIAVGRAGKGFSGNAVIRRKEEWPFWQPTQNMIRTEPQFYAQYANGLPGGPINPLGARALYLYKGGRDTFYRIHGTNDVKSIGHATSAGCIRLFNHDILDLYAQVPLDTPVTVRSEADSLAFEGRFREGPDGFLVRVAQPTVWPSGWDLPPIEPGW